MFNDDHECFLDRDSLAASSRIGSTAIGAGAVLASLGMIPERHRHSTVVAALADLRAVVRDLALVTTKFQVAPESVADYHTAVQELRSELGGLQ